MEHFYKARSASFQTVAAVCLIREHISACDLAAFRLLDWQEDTSVGYMDISSCFARPELAYIDKCMDQPVDL